MIGMLLLIFLWLIFFAFSFGVAGFIFLYMKNAAKKPWQMKIDSSYKPKISIIVPTYNEADIIHFKLENLVKVKYPKDLMQIIIVDSGSQDQTVNIAKNFIEQHPESNIQILIENDRRGKSAALNFALKKCEGEIVIISDADCFWPSDILEKALPFLADLNVGAISGPKILLNAEDSWVTRTEDIYLNSANMIRLGESKICSTLLFEGGFSAYKREVLESFDPYNTGSDDSGSIIALVEKGRRALLVPEARFYSAFPRVWKEKVGVKVRRANQLVRVFWRYFSLLLKGRVKGQKQKRIIIQYIMIYFIGPVMFLGLVAATTYMLFIFPYLSLMFMVFLMPEVRLYLFELTQSYVVLFISMCAVLLNKRFVIWDKPKDRTLIKEDILRRYELI